MFDLELDVIITNIKSTFHVGILSYFKDIAKY